MICICCKFIFMITNILKDKPTKLFLSITAFFVANALIAECIGGKIFSLEKVFGMTPSSFSLFGESGLSISLTCGVLLWPLEFIIRYCKRILWSKGCKTNLLHCCSPYCVCFFNVFFSHACTRCRFLVRYQCR